jgi:hypothetical protein
LPQKALFPKNDAKHSKIFAIEKSSKDEKPLKMQSQTHNENMVKTMPKRMAKMA